jgi:hypothetical protein
MALVDLVVRCRYRESGTCGKIVPTTKTRISSSKFPKFCRCTRSQEERHTERSLEELILAVSGIPKWKFIRGGFLAVRDDLES